MRIEPVLTDEEAGDLLLERAKALLRGELRDGPRSAPAIEALADTLDIDEVTLSKARHAIGVVTRFSPGMGRRWSLPKEDDAR